MQYIVTKRLVTVIASVDEVIVQNSGGGKEDMCDDILVSGHNYCLLCDSSSLAFRELGVLGSQAGGPCPVDPRVLSPNIRHSGQDISVVLG